MKKKILFALILVLTVLCALASCGDTPDDPPDGKDFTVTFVVGTTKTEVEVDTGEIPKAPTKGPKGYTIAGWDKTIVSATENTTYTAILTDEGRVTKELLLDAYQCMLFTQPMLERLPAGVTWYDKDTNPDGPEWYHPIDNTNSTCVITPASAMFTLALEEYENPQSGPVRDRLLEQLYSMTFEGNSPCFDCLPIWSNAAVSATIALAKMTPTVWEAMPEGMQERLDCIMRTFVAIVSYGSADWNNFRTGPALRGNYVTNYNINYGLANIYPIYNAAVYFGIDTSDPEEYVLDYAAGVTAANKILTEFDYDTYIADFEKYNFKAALLVWTWDKGTKLEGTAKLLMNEGDSTGNLPILSPQSPSGFTCGTGKGVNIPAGYTEFSYTLESGSYTLSQIVEMFNATTAWCFSGGTITSTGSDGRGYTLSDPEDNPMIGKPGMCAELNQGTSRSSLTYSRDDMIQYQAELCFLVALGIYDLEENSDTVELANNGINDMIYKFVKGYHSFAGQTDAGSSSYDSSYAGYFYMRALHMIYIGDDTMMYLFEDSPSLITEHTN